MASNSKAELLDKLWGRMSERGDFPMLSQALRTTVSAMSDDDLDFTALARGMGVPAARAASAGEFAAELRRALAEPGPHLIEAVLSHPG